MTKLPHRLKPILGALVLIGLGISLSGCIIVTPARPGYCYYHPYDFGC
jgi:hypothetical protein